MLLQYGILKKKHYSVLGIILGIKPFYYYLSENLFAFATEIKALLVLDDIEIKLNEKTLSFYLMGIGNDESTFFENIQSLNPANFLNLTQKSAILKKYWRIDPEFTLNMDTEEEYVTAFLNIFQESIKCRLRSLNPIGFELSGGMDSSSIVATTKKMMENSNKCEDINTFSFIFNKFQECDESYYIKKISDFECVKSSLVIGDEISPLNLEQTSLIYIG